MFIQQLGLSPSGTTHLELPARSYQGVLKSHLISIDTNMHDKGYCSTFALVNPTGDATGLVVIIGSITISTSTRQGSLWCWHHRSTRDPSKHLLRGNLVSNLEFYHIALSLYPTWIWGPIGRADGGFPMGLTIIDRLVFETDAMRVPIIEGESLDRSHLESIIDHL